MYPDAKPLFPLIENKVNKKECLFYLEQQGIKRPTMYTLGYNNNNCIGCVKGGMGYWNKIRTDFPDHFEKMAQAERQVGNSCIRGIFLDELDPEAGRRQKIVTPDCGNFCDIEFTEIMHPRVESVSKYRNIFMFAVGVYCRMKWPEILAQQQLDYLQKTVLDVWDFEN